VRERNELLSNDTNEQTITNKILVGKVALVTGGSRGLGVAIAYALANEGANVAVSYVSSADKANTLVRDIEKEKKLGVHAAAFQVDQGDPSQAEGLIQSVLARFGQLDILVNNAAVGYRGKTIDSPEIDNAAMDRQWAVNVTGVVANIRAAPALLLISTAVTPPKPAP